MSLYFDFPKNFPLQELRGGTFKITSATGLKHDSKFDTEPLDNNFSTAHSVRGLRLAVNLRRLPIKKTDQPVFVYADIDPSLHVLVANRLLEAFEISRFCYVDMSLREGEGKIVPWLIGLENTMISFTPDDLPLNAVLCSKLAASPIVHFIKTYPFRPQSHRGTIKFFEIPDYKDFIIVKHPTHGSVAMAPCEVAALGS